MSRCGNHKNKHSNLAVLQILATLSSGVDGFFPDWFMSKVEKTVKGIVN